MPEDVNWFSSVESSKLYYFYVIMGLTAMFTLLYGYIWPHCMAQQQQQQQQHSLFSQASWGRLEQDFSHCMAQDMIFMVLPRRWGGLSLLTARCHPVALRTCHCQLVSVGVLLSLDSSISCLIPLLLTWGIGHCCLPYLGGPIRLLLWMGAERLHFPFLVCWICV